MNTLPPLTVEDHVKSLLDWLRPHVPTIDVMTLRCFDAHSLERKQEHWTLAAAAVGDASTLAALIEQHSGEGREWVHLAGEGATSQGEYLVSVDYSSATGQPVTYINFGGPPLNPDGSVKHLTSIIIK